MTQRRAGRVLRALSVVALAAASPSAVRAQFMKPPAPDAYALRNVTIVAPDGSRTPGSTVVVRGKFVEAVAPGAAVPADARILTGDSLFVYPGLVDGWGSVKYEFPKEDVDRSKVQPWNAPRSVVGFEPSRRVVDYLQATGSGVADLRRKGVVAVAVQPAGALMPGRGAVVELRTDADQPNEMVLQPELGPVMTFAGARGAYPSTMMGMIAWYRQTFLDARHRAEIADAAGRGAKGVAPQAFDPDYAVVQRAMGGGTTVYWVADSENDIRRAVRLADEFRLKLVLVGGEEAWKVADLLKARDIPVLVSLDFPKPKQWKPGAGKATATDTTKAASDTADAKPATETAGAKDTTKAAEPMRPSAVREKERLEAMYANAGRLVASGVRVALVSNGGKADLIEGARKAIEYGLSPADALKAITSTPASLYGIPGVAGVAAGAPATFVVTTGPLFDKDSKVAYTFVEGGLEEGSTGGGAAGGDASAPAAKVAGTWTMEIQAQGAPPGGTLELTQNGAEVTGTFSLPGMGSFPVSNGKIQGNTITFTVDAGGMVVDFKGVVKGETASGSGSGGGVGSFDWSARRTSGPGGER